LDEYIYDKQPPEVKSAAELEKEAIEAQAVVQQPPSVNSGGAETPFFDIPALNVKQGLAFFEGDRETYLSALRSFIKTVPEMLDKLRDITEQNLPEYAINVHGLKSIGGWICADGIRARAASLEALSKAGDLFGVTTLNEALINETADFINELRGQLEAIDAGK
jgi:HPt (histidine-containing phosphotransfer) domain-containing protein